jgi:hypothetical protein
MRAVHYLKAVVVFLLGAFVPALAVPPPLPETLKNGELVLDFPIVFVAGTDQLLDPGYVGHSAGRRPRLSASFSCSLVR